MKKSSNAKKEFLEGDLIHRMIRIEQAVNAHFGKKLKYNETTFYKSLSKEQKKSLNRYRNTKKKSKFFKSVLLLVPLLVLTISQIRLTGQAISEAVNPTPIYGGIVSIGAFFAILMFLVAEKLFERISQKRLKRHEKYLLYLIKRSIYRKQIEESQK